MEVDWQRKRGNGAGYVITTFHALTSLHDLLLYTDDFAYSEVEWRKSIVHSRSSPTEFPAVLEDHGRYDRVSVPLQQKLV